MLRERVTLEVRSLPSDGMGGGTLTWSAQLTNIPAAVIPLSARERLFGMQLEMPISHRIVVRYHADWITYNADCRIVLDTTRYFNITQVIDVEERHRWLEMLAMEKVAQ
jgi:SPP1 family predicted phage head-tail adaptor